MDGDMLILDSNIKNKKVLLNHLLSKLSKDKNILEEQFIDTLIVEIENLKTEIKKLEKKREYSLTLSRIIDKYNQAFKRLSRV